ncbi:acyl carrier protein [compost metagenome]
MTISHIQYLKKIINQKLNGILSKEVEPGANLSHEGLDSIKTIELIVNLEVEFDIQIDDQDLLIENFSSVDKIAALLSGKYGVQA